MRIAVVTGASSGMGRDFVRELDRYGFGEIWAVARREEELKKLAEEIKTPLRILAYDLKEDESFVSFEKILCEEKPEIAYLVCAAGYGRFGSYKEIGIEESEGMISLNCLALVRMTYACLEYMNSGSKIIEIASTAAFQPLPYMNIYAASKAFVLSFSQALSFELKARGIGVTALCPGWVKTSFIGTAQKTNDASVTSFPGMSDSRKVVKKALRFCDSGRRMCVYGVLSHPQHIFARIFPSGLVMSAWNRIRRKRR